MVAADVPARQAAPPRYGRRCVEHVSIRVTHPALSAHKRRRLRFGLESRRLARMKRRVRRLLCPKLAQRNGADERRSCRSKARSHAGTHAEADQRQRCGVKILRRTVVRGASHMRCSRAPRLRTSSRTNDSRSSSIVESLYSASAERELSPWPRQSNAYTQNPRPARLRHDASAWERRTLVCSVLEWLLHVAPASLAGKHARRVANVVQHDHRACVFAAPAHVSKSHPGLCGRESSGSVVRLLKRTGTVATHFHVYEARRAHILRLSAQEILRGLPRGGELERRHRRKR